MRIQPSGRGHVLGRLTRSQRRSAAVLIGTTLLSLAPTLVQAAVLPVGGAGIVDLPVHYPVPMASPPSASASIPLAGSPLDRRLQAPHPPTPVCAPRQDLPGGSRTICSPAAHPRSAAADGGFPLSGLLGGGSGSTTAAAGSGSSTGQVWPDWVQQSPPTSPSSTIEGSAYDAARQRIVALDDAGRTWTWDGSTWTQQHPTTSPPPRYRPAMAYDAATQTVLLFGGGTSGPLLGDTWTWDGANWTQQHPAASPQPRDAAAVAYDPQLGRVILYGGARPTDGFFYFDDTWAWDGSTWTALSPAQSAMRRAYAEMAYDPGSGLLVLFGGHDETLHYDNQTWVFDGTTWSQRVPSASPSARGAYALDYDTALDAVVLFGGINDSNTSYNDTWMWTGGTWVAATGIASPPGGSPMSYDAATRQMVLTYYSGGQQTWTMSAAVPTLTAAVACQVGSTACSRGGLATTTLNVGNTSTSSMSGVTVTDTLDATLSSTTVPVSILDGQSGATTACAGAVTCTWSGQTLTIHGLAIPTHDFLQIAVDTVAVGLDRACSVDAQNAVADVPAGQSTPAALTVTTCDVGLGAPPWSTAVTTQLGDGAVAKVNVANGNLIVEDTDITPIPGHGRMGFTVHRVYNSEDNGIAGTPGQLAAGWSLSIDQTDEVAASGVAPLGLVVPAGQTMASPLPVTVIDRDGGRYLFQPRQLPPVDVTGMMTTTGPLGALVPKVLTLGSASTRICVDTTFTAPPGVHLSIWRYVELTPAGTTTPCTPAAGTATAVLGYGAMRPDRIRYEFAWEGHKLDMVDGNGNETRYHYSVDPPTAGMPPGDLVNVVEAASGRSITLPSASNVQLRDSTGRGVWYYKDGTPLPLLTKVYPGSYPPGYNPPTYTYGGCTGATAVQMCAVTDPRGNATTFTYTTQTTDGVAFVGPPRIASITDRQGTVTTFTYHASPDYVTVDTGTERTRYQSIDQNGRVGEIDEGDTSGTYLHQTTNTWDGGSYGLCAVLLDNDLCSVTRHALNSGATPDESTFYFYTAEGRMSTRHLLGVGTSTWSYHTQVIEANGTVTAVDDTITGSGGTSSSSVGDALTVYAITDQTGYLSPRGNAAGSGYAPYLVTYKVDDNSMVNPVAKPAQTTCTSPMAPTANTGNLCEQDAPPFDGSTTTVTRYTYGSDGEPATMTSPKAIAEAGANATPMSTTYTYYQDTDKDVSATISAGGWLKGITDPTGAFTAFGYDATGHVVRTWDRDATAGHTLVQFPGTWTAPTTPAYSETTYGGFSNPRKFSDSTRDPLGNTTGLTRDGNGNLTTQRPPRGTAANTSTYDIVQTFDKRDALATRLLPAEASANKPWVYGHDVYGNQTSVTDPNGNVTVAVFDAVNRQTAKLWTRGPWPADPSTLPPGCQYQTTATDSPLPVGRSRCTSQTPYDGVDNVTATTDANGQTTTFVYDAAHREISRRVPHGSGALATLRTDTVYDQDGHVTDVCPPRQFTDGGSTSCTQPSYYSEHRVYDVAGRLVSRTTYRTTGGAADTTTFAHDADGNVISTTDANGNTTTDRYDLLDRRQVEMTPRSSTHPVATMWTYDPNGNVTAVMRPDNHLTASSYDADNRLIDTVEGADNPVASMAGALSSDGGSNVRTRLAYDADGHVVAQFNANSFATAPTPPATTLTPDPRFMVRTDFDPDGRPVTQYTPRYDGGAGSSDEGGSPAQQTQCPTSGVTPQSIPGIPAYPSGVGVCVTTTSYDPAGNRASVILPTATGSSSNRHIDYAYTDDNLVSSVTTPSPAADGARVVAMSYLYDGDGRQVHSTDALNRPTSTSYFADGLTSEFDGEPNGSVTHQTHYAYDAAGNLTSVTDPAGNVTTTAYFNDNLRSDVVDGAGDHTSYTYDSVGNPLTVTSPNANALSSTGAPTRYTYTGDNLLLTATQPIAADGSVVRQTSYTYWDSGAKAMQSAMVLKSGTVSDAAAPQSFSYYNDGRLHMETGSGGETVTRTYTGTGQLASVADSTNGGSTISATYYLDDLPRTVTDGTATTDYTYNGAGQDVASVEHGPFVTGGASYGRNDAGLVTSTSGGWSWAYDAAGQFDHANLPNGLTLIWGFAPDATLTSINLRDGTNPLAGWSYIYDADYRKTQESFQGTGGNGAPLSVLHQLTYDTAGRLASWTMGSNPTTTITWDHDGNRLTMGGTTWTYNADDSLATTQPPGSVARTSFYSPTGDLTSDGCTTFTYDGFDRLITANSNNPTVSGCPAASTTSVQYDGLDRQRTHADSAGTSQLHYDGLTSTVAEEHSSTHNFDLVYDITADHNVLGYTTWTTSPTTAYHEALIDDGAGNVTTAITDQKRVTCQTLYDPFGGFLTGTPCTGGGSSDNTLYYHGGRPDATAGTYQMGARTYDPSKSAFLQPDAYSTAPPSANLGLGVNPATRNLYGYVNGDPVNFIDPTGHNPCANDDCPPAVNTQLAAGSTPGISLPPAAVLPPPPPSVAAPSPATADNESSNDLSPPHYQAAFHVDERPYPDIAAPDRHVADINGAFAPDATITFGLLEKLCDGELMGIIKPQMTCKYVSVDRPLSRNDAYSLCQSLELRGCVPQGVTAYMGINGQEDTSYLCLSGCADFTPQPGLYTGAIVVGGNAGADEEATAMDTIPNPEASTAMTQMLERGLSAGIDCSEIACDLFNTAGRRGAILRVDPQEPGLNLKVLESGTEQRYLYHEVYSDGSYVFDPRFSSEPIPFDNWWRGMIDLNPSAAISGYRP